MEDSQRWDGTSATGYTITQWARERVGPGRFRYMWAGMQWDAAVYTRDNTYVRLEVSDLVAYTDEQLVVYREGILVPPKPLPAYHNPVNDFDIGDTVHFTSGSILWTVVGKGATTGLTLRSNRSGRERGAHTFDVVKVVKDDG
jgi:hypothetical protein